MASLPVEFSRQMRLRLLARDEDCTAHRAVKNYTFDVGNCSLTGMPVHACLNQQVCKRQAARRLWAELHRWRGKAACTDHALGGRLVQVAVLVYGALHAVRGDVDAAGIAPGRPCLNCRASISSQHDSKLGYIVRCSAGRSASATGMRCIHCKLAPSAHSGHYNTMSVPDAKQGACFA